MYVSCSLLKSLCQLLNLQVLQKHQMKVIRKDQPQAWAIYQVREWKRVLTVSGGAGKERRVQITETP